MDLSNSLIQFIETTGFANLTWGNVLMIGVACVLLFLAIKKGFEPLLLVPIGFGMLLANIPISGITAPPVMELGPDGLPVVKEVGGLLYYIFQGDVLGIFPPLIFLGIGAMTDFGPLIANPKSLLLGAAAQLGVFLTFWGALFLGYIPKEAASIGIIGGADGPTAIFLTTRLAPYLLGPIAVAAYSYMALVPIIIPPVAKLFTTKAERQIVMKQLKPVSKTTKILFPIVATILVSLTLPPATPLIGMLMLGNLFRECGVVERLSDTVQNALINIVTIFLGTTVGATATAEAFLNWKTIGIFLLGAFAFAGGAAGGVLLAKLMNLFVKEKVNPLIGAAGVSAVPMAARVVQKMGQQENPRNFLLMHAMGPNVAGVIGTAVAAGVLLTLYR
ncbi:sodium ion-translocating decarboxylase subunit beta [Candidatus Formimonas warabiya]|uniref:Glutaconyl-CoA decarboxylase subunit beta n=1 Tax=Formimonas warabiya TaxID=1761012 RepID=A0A3G1KPP9_FORW1|nr:sodium ion-translocating decarboxylase subunit beta [Candidatus Formimonas warabiya]ATW24444.1 glutaconyl-CoA decarboxylase subunit beta [Candidatus Formimonas warabiya]